MEQAAFSKSAEQCASKILKKRGVIQKMEKVANPMSSAISVDIIILSSLGRGGHPGANMPIVALKIK